MTQLDGGAVHILVCDDEPDIRDMMETYLSRRGYRVSLADGAQALDETLNAAADDINLLILDISMPGEDGLSVLKRLRSDRTLPVIMVTAAGDTVDRIVGLELGADDYLAKPVDLRELEARIKSVLRRTVDPEPVDVAYNAEGVVVVDGLKIDLEGAQLTGRDGQPIALTAMEFSLLRAFAERRGRVLNRDQLLQIAHDRDWDPFDRSIDIRISRLRRKIERNPSHPVLIRTVRGLGYVFDQT